MKKTIILLIIINVAFLSYSETINDNHVRLRKYPFLNMEILNNMSADETIEVLLRSDFKEKIYNTEHYWYQVNYNDTIGWVYGEFINGLLEESEYRVVNFNNSKSKVILDYDFSKNEFVDLKKSENVYIRGLNIPYAKSNGITCWFDPVEIRSSEGYNGTSNLHIKTESKEIILYGERTNYFYDECSFIKLSPNNEYLIIDQGTGHLRSIDIRSTDTGKTVTSGSYISDIKYNGGNKIMYFSYRDSITADKDKAISYIKSNNITDIDGNNYQTDIFRKKIEDAPEYASFYFGSLYSFDLVNGNKNSEGNILYYIDIQ